jgi:beta-lactamase superfamily II metal-dependent hydrolase
MFTLHMLPAGRGDCLWIEYGSADRRHHVLIDGGVQSTRDAISRRFAQLPPEKRKLDLLVITHIDLDHIAGVLELLRDPPDGLQIDDIWFNGWKHLPEDAGLLGAKQGESVSAYIQRAGYPWNKAFGGDSVAVTDYDSKLPVHELAGGMRMTLISPILPRLARLRKTWEKEILETGLNPGEAGDQLEELGVEEPGEDIGILGSGSDLEAMTCTPFAADNSAANGSSIGLIAEYDGKRCLLTGDAYATDISAGIRQFLRQQGENLLTLEALKLSHHGGRKNTNTELLELLACNRFLFSTDGSYYEHPDAESVARVIVHGRKRGDPHLLFNHRVPETERWANPNLHHTHPYVPVYPIAGTKGLSVEM